MRLILSILKQNVFYSIDSWFTYNVNGFFGQKKEKIVISDFPPLSRIFKSDKKIFEKVHLRKPLYKITYFFRQEVNL
jgi:hypothetical protein